MSMTSTPTRSCWTHRHVLGVAAATLVGSLCTLANGESATIDSALNRASESVQQIIDVPRQQRSFNNTVSAIDDLLSQLELDTNMTLFLAHVSTDAEVRKVGRQAEKDVTNWLIELGKNEELYQAVRSYADTRPDLRGEDARLMQFILRDYRRSGMDLSADQRNQLKALQKKLTDLTVEFDTNITTDETRVPLTRAELPGMPDSYFEQFKPTDIVDEVYLVNMSYPQFLPIMDLCEDETTRKKVWVAYKRRGGQRNVEVLQQILKLRAEIAQMLGYQHPADYEIEVRMAKNAATVKDFYKELRPLVRRKALLDLEEFTQAKREHTGNRSAKLEAWDTSFYQKRLMRDKYAVDSETVREYFPLDAVTDGLFKTTQSLYGLEYRDITSQAGDQLWHEDVELYQVRDTATNEVIGEFYLDLFPRDNKYGHAAQWGLAQHKLWSDGRVTKPRAALVCNFPLPTSNAPSLLSHDQVETYFHEFGHCLHTLLSEAKHWRFSGTGVERDFVEAPSQMFENWVWNADVLNTFARHYATGDKFPADLLAGMVRAKHLGSGMLAERQFFYGLYDLTCHLDATGEVDTTQLSHDLWDPTKENIELYDPVPGTWFQAAFGHLTGYQAGYYGYQWSLVYACDMFERFKELGMLSPSAGKYYRDHILSRGGTKDGLDLVRDYLGREPDKTAYLRHLGLGHENN